MINTALQPTPTNKPKADKPAVTFTDLSNNPDGIVLLAQTAKLFNRHTMTIRRWIKNNPDFPRPLTINGMYYFKNADLLSYVNALEHTHEGA